MLNPQEKINFENFELVEPQYAILEKQRKKLFPTQKAAASAMGIALRQYQRYASGERSLASASFNIGLRICKTLDIDPFTFL